VDPPVAFARKGEYGVPELSRRERAYRDVFSRLPQGVTIRNDSLDVAKRQLFAAVFDTLGRENTGLRAQGSGPASSPRSRNLRPERARSRP
jgi:hypothetical protein